MSGCLAMLADLLEQEWQEFWYRYPARVGKLAAHAEYLKARKQASAADILAAVDRYIRDKPDWQQWAHPKTWLRQGRYLDPGSPEPDLSKYEWHCPHTPVCPHRAACAVVSLRKQA